MEVFSPEWAAAWQASINADATYREAGRRWVGAVVLKVWADEPGRSAGAARPSHAADGGARSPHATDPAPTTSSAHHGGGATVRAVLAHLAGGTCREARVATPADEAHARIVIGAPRSTWAEVLAGDLDPMMGLIRGRLKLERGSLVSLVPHARGARALLATAARLDATMPLEEGRSATVRGPGGEDLSAPAPPVADGAGWVRVPAAASTAVRSFRSTRSGLDHDGLPMRL